MASSSRPQHHQTIDKLLAETNIKQVHTKKKKNPPPGLSSATHVATVPRGLHNVSSDVGLCDQPEPKMSPCHKHPLMEESQTKLFPLCWILRERILHVFQMQQVCGAGVDTTELFTAPFGF